MSVIIDSGSRAQRSIRIAVAAGLVAAVAASFLPGSISVAASAPVGEAVVPVKACLEQQKVTIRSGTAWRCVLSLTSQVAYVVRAAQRDVDVRIVVLDTSNRQLLATNSPARRAGMELALIGPQIAGRYFVEVHPVELDVAATGIEVSIDRLAHSANPALIRGLSGLTLAAAPERNHQADESEKSVGQLRSAVESFRAAHSQEYEAEALLRIASVYYWRINDWAQAAAAAAEAIAAYSRTSDAVMQSQGAVIRAASLIEIANAMKQPGRRGGANTEQTQFDEAMSLLLAATQRFQQAAMPYDQAQAINYLGIALFYQGQYAEARTHFQQAARIFRALGERTSEALPLQNIAMIDYDAGDYAKAIGSYQSLLRVLSPKGDPGYYMSVLLNLGNAQYVTGDFEYALHSFMTALQLSEEKVFVAEQARSLHGLGLVYLAIGEHERAAVFLERALALRRTIAQQDPRGLLTSQLRVGDLKRENGEVRRALDLHLEALDNALTVTDKARALYSIGRDHESQDDAAAAMQAYESALKLALPEDWPVRVAVMGAYGRSMVRSGDAAGRELVLKAARLNETRGDSDLAAQNFLTLALDDRNHGRLNAAVSNVERALALFESQRLRTVNPDLRATYLGSRAAAFELQSDLYTTLWQQAADPAAKRRMQTLALSTLEANRRQVLQDFSELAQPVSVPTGDRVTADDVVTLDALIAAKRHRLAVIMEQPTPSPDKIESLRRDIGLLRTRLDLAQARTGAQAKGAPTAGPLDRSPPAIQASLGPDSALLVYQLGEDRSWVWVVTRETAAAYVLPPRAEIDRAARSLYASWSVPGIDVTDVTSEVRASRTILGPAAARLRGKTTVMVVTDGILRSLPFGALWIEAEGGGAPTRLMDTHAIVFRSSLSAESTPAPGVAAEPSMSNRILLIGDPTVSSPAASSKPELRPDPWSWQPLPGARREVETIADMAIAWRSYVLLGAEATKPALLGMPLDTFRAIHFATHARLDVQDPQLSSIALSSGEASFASSSSTLTVREILGFNLRAEAVVLSACEASLGKNYRGQLSFGLSEAFLLAGAHNVLGSLWRVSDDGAQEYMRRFYEEYMRNGASPAAAAQGAARTLSRKPGFRHPYYWAAFVVTQL